VTFESEAPDIYHGMNPSFVRQVWAKRRREAGSRVQRKSGNRPGAPPKWTAEQKASIAQMMVDGLSAGRIAKKFGTTPNAIYGLIHGSPELKAIGLQTSYAKKLRERSACLPLAGR
jgi:transposase-like protein